MLNLFLGQSGGGKSYEAVVFHVIPALKDGRKVITNLILNMDEISKIVTNARDLVEFRHKSRGSEKLHPVTKEPFPLHAFAAIEDYGDQWRHPVKGYGPLYVIDECHKALPRGGTRREVEEWYAEHRHELCDVLLITQSYGKLSKAIADNVQVVYRCKKAVAFGKPDRYIRKVQDGVRGEVMDTSEREYEAVYFKLYKSHTKSLAGVMEALAGDINPAYKKWLRASVAMFGVAALVAACQLFTPDKPKSAPKAAQPASARTKEHASPAVVAAPVPASSKPVSEPVKPVKAAPFDGMGIHLQGAIRMGDHWHYAVVLSQNGVGVAQLGTADLERAGYTVEPLTECAARVLYEDREPVFIRCDLPKVAPVGDNAPKAAAST